MANSTTEPARAAGVIAKSKAGRILMVRRTDGEGWAFPGGGIKEGEAAVSAALREFWEETGHQLSGPTKLFMRRIKDGVDFTTYTVPVDDEFIPKLNHEHDAYAWVDPMTTLDEAKFSYAAAPAMQMPIYADDAAKADGDWEEHKHPRGQPGNAGQFGSGGGGAAAGMETKAGPGKLVTEGEAKKVASEAPKGSSASSPAGEKSAPVPTSEEEETDPEIKRMAQRLAPTSDKLSSEEYGKRIEEIAKDVPAEKQAKVAKATKKFFATTAIAGVLSMIGKEAVANTLSAAQMKAVETAGEFVTDTVADAVSSAVEYALGGAVTILGIHLGHDAGSAGAAGIAVGFVARFAITKTIEKLGIDDEGLGRKLLTKACRAILDKVKGKKKPQEAVEGTGDSADDGLDDPAEGGDDDEQGVIEAIQMFLELLEDGKFGDELDEDAPEEDDGLEAKADSGAWNPADDEKDGLTDDVLDLILSVIEDLDARIERSDAIITASCGDELAHKLGLADDGFADEFKEEDHPRGHPKNSGMFSSGGGGIVEPAEPHEKVEPFEEPKKDPSEGGKKLIEANQPAPAEEHEKNLEKVKAKGDLDKQEMKDAEAEASDKQHEQAKDLIETKAKVGEEAKAGAEAKAEKDQLTFAPIEASEFIEARNKSTRSQYMSPLKPEDLAGYKLFTNADRTVGAAVDPKGDIQNVFNNGGPKGAAAQAMVEAIKQGGKTLDAYDTFLPKYYRQFGFEETGRMKFNPEFAHDWDPANGTPDVVFMQWKGYGDDTEESVMARAKNRKGWLPNVKAANYEDDYDAAKERSRQGAGDGGKSSDAGGAGSDRGAGEGRGAKAEA
jgi:8-oxo-dGTP pyrophosphatase MutT (NUDIX family)